MVAVEASSILVAAKGQKTASRVTLPCRVVPQQANVQLVGSVCEVKLVTLGSTSPTKSRADLEIHSPLTTDDLRTSSPTAIRCVTCDAELANTSTVSRWNALPSEYWAELLDAWMCHQDQKLSDDLIAKGKGIKPRPDEVLVATSYLLLPRELTSNWTAPEQAEVRPCAPSSLFSTGLQRKSSSLPRQGCRWCRSSSGTAMAEGAPPRDARLIQESKMKSLDHRPKQLSRSRSRCEGYIGRDTDAQFTRQPAKANNGDFLHAAHCSSCDALIGSHVLPADGNTLESTAVRLLKYATYPASSDPARPAPHRQTLSTYLTADMLETGQAHACHRFILEDAKTEQAKLLVRCLLFPRLHTPD